MSATRRDFIRSIVVAAGTAAVTGGTARPAQAGPTHSAEHFPQGVASGDPKPHSVVLWTRSVDPADPSGALGDVPLRLQVSTSRRFSLSDTIVDVPVSARTFNGCCLRVKVTNLTPRQYYYYRFLTIDGQYRSLIGRTRTAPLPEDNAHIRFAFASCQDYIGRYFNSYLPLLTLENDGLDFIVHLGDFIYETNGDSRFQPTSGRFIEFEDEAGTIALGTPEAPYDAARSLANYRQLHRRYRTDTVLQQVLAKFPMIAIWDDHEFSDDGWRANGAYFNGLVPEHDVERKRNAEKAWLEFLPIDDSDEDRSTVDIIRTGADRVYPNAHIYRSLRFGRVVNLTLTDYRSFRSDHLIAEDAFPGAIAFTQQEIEAYYTATRRTTFAADTVQLDPYVDASALPPPVRAALLQIVTGAYVEAGLAPVAAIARATLALAGNVSITYLNLLIQAAGLAGAVGLLPTAGKDRGLSYLLMGKSELFSQYGARYGVTQKWYDLYAALRGLNAQIGYGEAQRKFVNDALKSGADVRWNILASSVSFTSMILDLAQDLSNAPAILRPLLLALQASPFGTRIKLNADQWDGFPQRRDELSSFLRRIGNVVIISGDIHSSWVTDHSDRGKPLFELTGPAISSSNFGNLVQDAIVAAAKSLGFDTSLIDQMPALLPELTEALNAFLIDRVPESAFAAIRQRLEFVDVSRNGIVIVDAPAETDTLTATYWLSDPDDVRVSYYANPGSALRRFRRRTFVISKDSGITASS